MAVDALPFRSARIQIPVMLVSLSHGSTHLVSATFFLLLPAMSRELGLNYTETGLLVTAFFIGSMLANPPGGMLVDLLGRRIFFQILALLLGSFMLAALGIASNFATLWLCLLLLGAANTLWHPAAISYLSILLPRNRGYSMAIHSVGASLGDALGPLAAGALLASYTWQTAAAVNALSGVVCALALGLVLGRGGEMESAPRRPPSRDYWRGLLVLLSSRAQWSFFLMAGLRTMTQAGLLAFLPLYLARELHMSPVGMGAAMMALQVGGILATPIAGTLSDRIGRRPIVLAGMTSTTIIVLALTFVSSALLYVACISVLGFVMYATRPVVQSWQMDLSPPEYLATLTSAMFAVQSAMAALSPLIGGALADHFGLIAVFYFLAASVLAANLLCAFMPRTERRA